MVLTTSDLPLRIGSPLVGFDVRTLRTVARIGQSRFEFFADRQAARGRSRWGRPGLRLTAQTTLRYVRSLGKAFIEGRNIRWSPGSRPCCLP
ncbi:hypothetical protein [Ralstonia pseudosolanacearum]|uniref:hypothetical protein n=1 Tax=Ralstonia pseudosolanacearum TaxID=1310165 RepID=UPI001E4BEBE5|nr:hypothetical protein [Ralstonia pseudosolanacearum]